MITLIFSCFSIIPMMFGGVGICIGTGMFVVAVILVLLPIEGFDSKQEEDCKKLIKLRGVANTSSPIYLELKNNKATYAFDNRRQYELNNVAYEEVTVRGKIKVYEAPDCEQPIMKVFKTRPNTGDWTFAPFSTKTEYVFQVPPKTVRYMEY